MTQDALTPEPGRGEPALTVVTVTYSPGPHLDRFLSSLTVATDRPLTVVMADNGSTDGAPEEAAERYPGTRLLRTGSNLGYGTAVNRGVAYLEGRLFRGTQDGRVLAGGQSLGECLLAT